MIVVSTCFFLFLAVPKIEGQSQSKQAINSTESLNLQCPSTGYPDPTVVWRKVSGILPKERMKTEDKGKLVITDLTKADNGVYICIAANGIGSDSRNFTVFVQGW